MSRTSLGAFGGMGESVLYPGDDAGQTALAGGGQLGLAESDPVKDCSDPADVFVDVAGEKQERAGELHGRLVRRAVDLVAGQQANEIIIKAELAGQANSFMGREGVDADALNPAAEPD